jgi:cytochrome c oxidase assembly protein subunit 11
MRDNRLSLKLALLTVAMFGFGFALVPIYDVFCAVTGFGGRTSATAQTVVEHPDENRSVRLEFIASVNRSAPFEFHPNVASMQVTPGKIYETAYFARNQTDAAIVARAVPSVYYLGCLLLSYFNIFLEEIVCFFRGSFCFF